MEEIYTRLKYTLPSFDILKDYSEFTSIHASLPNYLAVHLPKENLSISSLQKERKRGKFRENRDRANLWTYPSISRSLLSIWLDFTQRESISN